MLETQKNKLNAEEEQNPVLNNKSISETLSNSNINFESHCRMVSVADDQVPSFNHLVSNPQSWIPESILKRSTQGIIMILFY